MGIKLTSIGLSVAFSSSFVQLPSRSHVNTIHSPPTRAAPRPPLRVTSGLVTILVVNSTSIFSPETRGEKRFTRGMDEINLSHFSRLLKSVRSIVALLHTVSHCLGISGTLFIHFSSLQDQLGNLCAQSRAPAPCLPDDRPTWSRIRMIAV